ncbi:MAG: hypothetical protein ACE5JP_08210 [Candidatus Bipolaricaulia bacterium]
MKSIGIRERLVERFAEQPEITIPEEIIDRAAQLREIPGLAIVEIAGRDSIAAAIKAFEEGHVNVLLPTVAYNGAQYGSLDTVEAAIEMLRDQIGAEHVLEATVIGSPKFWLALNLRYQHLLYEQFGFFTSCVGCHLYIHAIRVPLARHIGCRVVISGEREIHQRGIKVNQRGIVLDHYAKLLAEFGIELLHPIRKIDAGDEIVRLLGRKWEGGKDQLHCVLSGSYRDPDGSVDYGPGRRFSDEKSARFLEEFGLPVAQVILEKLCRGEAVDYDCMAANVLEQLQQSNSNSKSKTKGQLKKMKSRIA